MGFARYEAVHTDKTCRHAFKLCNFDYSEEKREREGEKVGRGCRRIEVGVEGEGEEG